MWGRGSPEVQQSEVGFAGFKEACRCGVGIALVNEKKRISPRSTNGHLKDPVLVFVENTLPYVDIIPRYLRVPAKSGP